VEQILLQAVPSYLKENNVLRNNQHGFARDKSSLSNLIAFCDERTGPVSNWERTMDVIYLYFSKLWSKSTITSLQPN